MAHTFQNHLLNRPVLIVFSLLALGYLGFLSQFVFGEPTGLVRGILEGLFWFALPFLPFYSILLGALPPVDQDLGTAGFFIFIYVFAVVLVWVTRQIIELVRERPPPDKSSHSETDG